jgi:hypothetical protein
MGTREQQPASTPTTARSRRRRLWAGAALAAGLVAGVWTYDTLGYQQAVRFEAEHAGDAAAVLGNWQTFQAWHPSRHLLGVSSPRAEGERIWELTQHQAKQDDDTRSRQAQAAFDELQSAERRGVNLALLLEQADDFLREYSGTPPEVEVRRLRVAYAQRVDERDFECARGYSAEEPFQFAARREYYQAYLDRHPTGAFVHEAQSALQALDADGDKHEFRKVRDQFVKDPGNLGVLVPRCRAYLSVHPRGRFAAATTDLLRWTERVSVPGEYRVVLREGQVERRLARTFSRGPDLSIEIEVAGVRHGPSTIVRNSYSPVWDYEFPRRVRWMLGDPVRIRVTDHDYWRRVVLDVVSADNDPLAMLWLTGDVFLGGNRLTFASDFTVPALPPIE